MKKIIEKHALINALQHEGKASPKAVMNKVLGELRGKKIDFKKLAKNTDKTVKDTNKIGLEKQTEKLKKLHPEFFKVRRKTKEKGLPALPKAVKGKVVLRFEPSPSGPLHIGHTFILLINSLYKKKYNGKLIVRISDTNPTNIYLPAYKQIVDNAQWVTNNAVDEVEVQSDRMKIYYQKAKDLITSGFAYVCTCRPEKFKEFSTQMVACPCRQMTPEENLNRWKDMFYIYHPGGAALRIKTDVTHKNPAMREWVAFRITEERHSRQTDKYRVWPMMNFAVPIDDHEMGVTHVIRGKDHESNAEKQAFIYKYFRWKLPEFVYLGRINFKGLKLSTTQFRQQINSKAYTGWNDIRLPTLFALQRRGIQPEALEKYVGEIGPSKADKTVNYSEYTKTLYRFNKEIIDSESNRYYFVPDPVKLHVRKAPSTKVVGLKVHPDKEKIREVRVSKVIGVPKKDFKKYSGKEIRLKGLYNVKLSSRKLLKYSTAQFTGTALKAKPTKIQWVAGKGIKTEVLMLDGKKVSGISELGVSRLKEGSIVQFERFGFCRLDKKDKKKLIFVFTHS